MSSNSLMEKILSILGVKQPESPLRNDFRNPIWGDDDEDDGDELYDRNANINIHTDPDLLNTEIARHMEDVFRNFTSIFEDKMNFFHFDNTDLPMITDEPPNEADGGKNIRDYYLKPGYYRQKDRKDIDLDGKISSQEISGLLNKQNSDNENFDGTLMPGRSFCKTIITTSIRKPDGTVETRRIVKDGNGVMEDTTTTVEPSTPSSPQFPLDMTQANGVLDYNFKILSNILSNWSNFF